MTLKRYVTEMGMGTDVPGEPGIDRMVIVNAAKFSIAPLC